MRTGIRGADARAAGSGSGQEGWGWGRPDRVGWRRAPCRAPPSASRDQPRGVCAPRTGLRRCAGQPARPRRTSSGQFRPAFPPRWSRRRPRPRLLQPLPLSFNAPTYPRRADYLFHNPTIMRRSLVLSLHHLSRRTFLVVHYLASLIYFTIVVHFLFPLSMLIRCSWTHGRSFFSAGYRNTTQDPKHFLVRTFAEASSC